MKKKILLWISCIALTLGLAMSFTACDLTGNQNKPSNPDNPNEPFEPDNPDKPDNPNEPDEPSNPDEPDEPEKPDTPSGELKMRLAGNGYYVMGIGTFEGTDVVIPETYGEDNLPVSHIAGSAFENNTTITSVTISKNIVNISTDAFAGCTNLATINFNATECTSASYTSFKNVGRTVNGGTVFNVGENVKCIPEHIFDSSNGGASYVGQINFPEDGALEMRTVLRYSINDIPAYFEKSDIK